MCKDLGNNQYQCNGNCNAGGTVWGTGLYTSDSNVYRAAKHMGITGKFRKTMAPGFQKYLGTNMNGVATNSYNNYGSSYILTKIGDQNKNLQNSVQKSQLKKMFQQMKISYSDQMLKYNKSILHQLKKDVPLCIICLEKERTRMVLPCSHVSYCQNCIKQIRNKAICAVCKSKVTGDMEVFI